MVSQSSNLTSISGYRRLDADEITNPLSSRQFSLDVLTGLSEKPKRLPSRYFYDDEGSRLFSAICDNGDYYPTRSETEILETYLDQILDQVGNTRPINVVDLGAGDGRKTMVFLDRCSARGIDAQFVPIDISEGAMRDLVEKMGNERPELSVQGIVADYFDGLHWLSQSKDRLNLVLFLGSNIGNFNKYQARVFLRQLWEALNPHDLLFTGFDLKKDIDILLRAYNDSEGLTARFNLNLLTRINRELGANFDTNRFRHYGTYDVQSGAMESYLVSLAWQSVYIDSLHQTFEFEPFEAVHTEYSYKFLETDIEELAAATDFRPIGHWYDSRHWFTNHLWRVEKSVPR
ncbi:MAG: L-histidine N(alpha)-methyltransferase [Myxococcota bacterium]